MLNTLISFARGLVQIGVAIFVIVGAIMGGNMVGEADRVGGYLIGGFVGFVSAALVFGIVAAIFDMQESLRVLADAARRGEKRDEPPLAPPLGRKDPLPLR